MGNTASTPFELCVADILSRDDYSIPADPFFQETAVKSYNKDIPIVPSAVARPSSTEQVSQLVACAVQYDVKVQAGGGGHSYANYCIGGEDGALVVDLENFQKFEIDESTWLATVGGGTLLGDLTERMHDNGGRAMAHGTCPQVGIGGHATIGGLGPTSRQWGAALDHIKEVEVVLANSTVVRASDNENQDLFFAVKGAAAGFGIVTEFVVETHPEPGEMVEYSYTFALGKHADMASTFAKWQEIVSDPDFSRKMATKAIVLEGMMIVTGTFFGSQAEYDELDFEGRLTGDATDVAVGVLDDWLGAVGDWAETEGLQLVGGIPSSFYSKSLAFTPDSLIPQEGIDKLFSYFDTADKDTLLWFAIFDLAGGAINDIPANATAYGHRDTLFYLQTYGIGLDGLHNNTRTFIEQINVIIEESLPDVDFGAYAGYVE